MVPCLVCSAKPWLFRDQRDLTGVEALGIQGYSIHEINQEPTRFRNKDLLHLAGNAMSGFMLSAIFLALFITMDWDGKQDIKQSAPCAMPDQLSSAESATDDGETDDGETDDGESSLPSLSE